jgi:hypothetical protein
MSNDNDDLFRGFMERKTPYQLLSEEVRQLREEVQELRALVYALVGRVGDVEKQVEQE